MRVLTCALFCEGYVLALSLWPISLKLECNFLVRNNFILKSTKQRKMWFPFAPSTTGKPWHLGEGIGLTRTA